MTTHLRTISRLLSTGVALGFALLMASTAPVLGRADLRIVSINPCVDAILMQVADPAQIAGISHYSQDARSTSVSLALAARFKATSGTAEEVMALAPDLVIAGPHVAPSTIAALKRLKIQFIQLGVPQTIAQSRAQIRLVAQAVGHPARGETLVAAIDQAVRRAAPAGQPVLPALIWLGGGLVPGSGTLADELLSAAGFDNLSASYGLQQWDVLPLEYVVAKPPRVLLSIMDVDAQDRMLGHPVLRHLQQRIAIRAFPERLLHCGGPTIIDVLDRLRAVRRSL